MSTVGFTNLCLNGQLVACEGCFPTLKLSEQGGRSSLTITVVEALNLELDVKKCVSGFTHSRWDANVDLILDFQLVIGSVPPWMLPYSRAPAGCNHRIQMTLKVQCLQPQYAAFTRAIRLLLNDAQYACLESSESLTLWNTRCNPPPRRTIRSVRFRIDSLHEFPLRDLQRLKDKTAWLSDTHIDFALQDFFHQCLAQQPPPNQNLLLLPCAFWTQLSKHPEKFTAKYRSKTNLLKYDFVVMPMYGSNHWRLGIIENPAGCLEDKTVFHIIDSLPTSNSAQSEVQQLQRVFLKYFDQESFKKGRIAANVAQVPTQSNSYDCGCYAIFFARRFIASPDAILKLIKIRISSPTERRLVWEMNDGDMTWLRADICNRLLNHISRGEADIELAELS